MRLVFILAISMTANLILVMILFASRHATKPIDTPSLQFAASSPVSSAGAGLNKSAETTPAPVIPWGQVASADYRQYIANLRAVDCPEWLVRDIIVADIDDFYRSKSRIVPLAFVPWQSERMRVQVARSQSVKLETLNQEKRAFVKSLLGYEWFDCTEQIWNLDLLTTLTLGFLPEEKLSLVLSLKNQYADAAQKIREEANFILIDEDHAKLDLLFKDFQAELSRQLGANELDEFQLRAQQGFLAANDLHFEGVAISLDQIREIIRLSTSVKSMARDEFSADGPLSAAEREQRQAIFQAQVRSLLGAQRFTDYQRAQDFNFREIYSFIQQHELPQSAAISVFETRQFTDVKANKIQNDDGLTAEERMTALAVLKAVAANKTSAALGGSFQTYLAGPGQWLVNLATPVVQTP